MKKHNFIQVQQRLYDCQQLDIYHINILSWIMSYNRESKDFFMSADELAKKFKCSRFTVYRRIEQLEEWKLISKDGKVKRSWKWKCNPDRIHYFIERDLYQRDTKDETFVSESKSSNKICIREEHYNTNNKTSSNKTSFKEEEAFGASPPTEKVSLEAWANSLDIE